jgi:hypothetical protein
MTDDDLMPATVLITLAERCENGARDLLHLAANAAEILPTRMGGHLMDPAEWAAQKRTAAGAATDYAAALRAEAAELTRTGGHATEQRVAQAERVASATQCDGILIDGRPVAERKAESTSIYDQHERELWAAGEHPAQVKAREIEATGLFEHVAPVVDGERKIPVWELRQVPDWQLNPAV